MQSAKPLLAEADLERLAKLCGLFSSEHMGERAAAASLADQFLRDRGYRWSDVLNAPVLRPTAAKPRPRKPDPFERWGGWRPAAQHCLRNHHKLTDRERLFCEWLLDFGYTGRIVQREILLNLIHLIHR